jgi:hypothetical protein
VAAFKDLKFAGAVTETEVDDLVDELALQIEETEDSVNKLEAEVVL